MHKACECNNCLKLKVCKLVEDYNNKCIELGDTDTNYYVSKLYCKYFENRLKNGN